VFVDASALVPMELIRDQWHGRLVQVLADLRRAGSVRFLTSNWTLYEALALTRRAGHGSAVSLHRQVTRAFELVTVPPTVEAEALRRFLAWSDKQASVVVHANFLVARERRCDAILTFDSDFVAIARRTGMRLIGPR
jgi:predicted nucleic acid-binding protein